MRDAGPFDLDGTMGYSIEPGPLGGSVSGYHWDYVPPDAPPADPGRLAVVETTEVLNPGTADFVVEVRYRTTYPQGNVVQKGQSSTDGYWKVEQNDGKPTCFFRRTSTDNAIGHLSRKRVDDGAWHTIRCDAPPPRWRCTSTVLGSPAPSAPPWVRSSTASRLSIGGKTACNQISVGCDYFSGDIDFVTISKDVPNVPNTAPTMSIASTTCVTLTCTFDSSGSDDPDGTIADRAWDFGDGSTVADQDVVATHSFPAPGTYTVTLVGTDDDGASSDPVAATVTVNGPPNQPPAMSFSWACDAAVCAFDSSVFDADGSIASVNGGTSATGRRRPRPGPRSNTPTPHRASSSSASSAPTTPAAQHRRADDRGRHPRGPADVPRRHAVSSPSSRPGVRHPPRRAGPGTRGRRPRPHRHRGRRDRRRRSARVGRRRRRRQRGGDRDRDTELRVGAAPPARRNRTHPTSTCSPPGRSDRTS